MRESRKVIQWNTMKTATKQLQNARECREKTIAQVCMCVTIVNFEMIKEHEWRAKPRLHL